MATRWTKAVGLTLALAGAVLAGCSPRPAQDTAAQAGQRPPQGERTALGAYLAGRFAHAHGDTRAAAELYVAAAQRDPDNIELLQRAFTLLVAEGRLDAAAAMAQRLLAYDEDAAMPALVMGVDEARQGRFAEAEKRFSRLPRKGVTGFLGPLLTAWSRAGQGHADAALEAIKPLSSTAGFASIYEFHAGLITDLANRPGEAETHYASAVAQQVSIRTIEAAGSFYQRTGKPDRARDLYQRYHGEHPETLLFDGASRLAQGAAMPRAVASPAEGLAEALFDTASLMRQANAHDLAMVFSRLTLAVQPDFPLAQLLLADILAAQDRLPEANAVYRAIAPGTPVALFARLRVAVNLDEAGDTDAAVHELKALAAERPAATDPLTTLGDLLRRHKRFAEAAEAYGQAIARSGAAPEPRHWALYYARGVTLERSRQWAAAERDFLKALELQPEQPDVLNYLGYSWVDQGINLDAGRKMIERAVALRPRDGAIVDSLGWALYRLGEFQAAVSQLERAAELKPEDATINDHLGDALWQVGRVDEARYQWQRALALDPEPDMLEPLKAKVKTGELPAKPVKP